MMTAKMRQLYEFIEASETCPNFEEIRAHMGVSSKGYVFRMLGQLEERGMIRRLRHKARAIEVIRPKPRVQYLVWDEETKALVPRGTAQR